MYYINIIFIIILKNFILSFLFCYILFTLFCKALTCGTNGSINLNPSACSTTRAVALKNNTNKVHIWKIRCPSLTLPHAQQRARLLPKELPKNTFDRCAAHP